MLGMKPKGSDLPSYAPHRDLLYRMRSWVQKDGMANLRAREAEFTPEQIKGLNIVAVAIVNIIDACQRREIPLEGIPGRMDELHKQYPEPYAIVLHETFKSLFTQYRTFVGEALPVPTNPPSEDDAAKALAHAEARVEKYMARQEAAE